MDWDDDGHEELIVGSDDFSIRVFKGEELIHDINEQSKIQYLKKINKQIFAYSLQNGAYGVYHSKKRLWRQKSKDKVTALLGVNFDVDGQYIVVIGFQSGSIEARKHRTGEILHKTSLPSAISQLFYYDYRMEGQPQVIAVDAEGEVKGMNITRNVRQFLKEDKETVEEREEENKVLELNQKKIELMNKLEALKQRKEQRKLQKSQP